jgi:hypothetical protein
MLAMDSTTLTRTLAIMSRNSWITRRYGKDRRERGCAYPGSAKFNSSVHCPTGKKYKRGCAASLETNVGTVF